MPYIKKELRERMEKQLSDLVTTLNLMRMQLDGPSTPIQEFTGVLNYTITKICVGMKPRNYHEYHALLGLFVAVPLELYRRRIAPYEDQKIKENGDVY